MASLLFILYFHSLILYCFYQPKINEGEDQTNQVSSEHVYGFKPQAYFDRSSQKSQGVDSSTGDIQTSSCDDKFCELISKICNNMPDDYCSRISRLFENIRSMKILNVKLVEALEKSLIFKMDSLTSHKSPSIDLDTFLREIDTFNILLGNLKYMNHYMTKSDAERKEYERGSNRIFMIFSALNWVKPGEAPIELRNHERDRGILESSKRAILTIFGNEVVENIKVVLSESKIIPGLLQICSKRFIEYHSDLQILSRAELDDNEMNLVTLMSILPDNIFTNSKTIFFKDFINKINLGRLNDDAFFHELIQYLKNNKFSDRSLYFLEAMRNGKWPI